MSVSVNQFIRTNWVAEITQIDRHKSVRKHSVIEIFGALCVVSCVFCISNCNGVLSGQISSLAWMIRMQPVKSNISHKVRVCCVVKVL